MKRNYDDPAYKDWRIKILKRDNFQCQMPRCKNKKYLQVHHIKKWSTASSLRYDLSNGITVCSSCHREVNRNELYYESLFTEIVRRKNV